MSGRGMLWACGPEALNRPRSPITVLPWIHTVLKGQHTPGGNKQRSITNSLQALTASIRACGSGLGHQAKYIVLLCITLPSLEARP